MARRTAKNRRREEEKRAAEALKERRDYLRARKAKSQSRVVLTTLLPILLLVLGWLGFGLFNEGYREPRQPVARVEGQAITARTYVGRVQYARRQLISSLSSFMGMISSTDTSFITQYAGGQRTSVAQNTLDALIDDVLIRKEAERRGIEVSDDEVDARIRKDLEEALGAGAATPVDETEATATPDGGGEAAAEAVGAEAMTDTVAAAGEAEPADALTDTMAAGAQEEGAAEPADIVSDTVAAEAADAVTDAAAAEGEAADAVTDTVAAEAAAAEDEGAAEDEAAGEPAADATSATSDAEIERAFERLIQPMLNDTGMTRADYEELIRAQLFREKLGEALGAETPTTARQVEADHLLFSSKADADVAIAALEAGATWEEAVARFRKPEDAAGGPDAADEAAADEGSAEEAAAGDAAAEEAASDEATPAADAAPAATAEPTPTGPTVAVEVGEPRWYSTSALVERLGLTEADGDAVLALEAGATSEGLNGTQGTYVLHVRAVEDDRPIEESELQAAKDGALDAWLTKQRSEKSGEINRFPLTGITPDEPEWFVRQYEQIVGSEQAEVPLSLPTVATTP